MKTEIQEGAERMSGNSDFVIENGVLVQYNGPGGDVVIPEGVTEIGVSAFSSRTDLTSVVIPEGVTSIADYAFLMCKGLENIIIPEGITVIGVAAFYACTGLVCVTIPKSVVKIEESAFGNCENLAAINLSEGLLTIGDQVFSYCKKLSHVTLPESVTEIGNQAFYACTSLEKFRFPAGVKKLGTRVFSCCEKLETLEVDRKNSRFCVMDGLILSKNKKTVEMCLDNRTGVCHVPSGVTTIAWYAFFGCAYLTEIVLPETVTTVNTCASAKLRLYPCNHLQRAKRLCNVIIRSKSKAGNFISLSIFGCQHDDGVGMMFPDFLA